MKLFTIGFTKKSAEQFFTTIKNAGVRRVLDIRLNRDSQLSGFAKERDLRFFLPAICSVEYRVVPELAPTEELLDAYKKQGATWESYEAEYRRLLVARRVDAVLTREIFDGACLLCSEATAAQCHRRLAAEYLQQCWSSVEVRHL
jgi:uncharacterized protein (DUF488 family)